MYVRIFVLIFVVIVPLRLTNFTSKALQCTKSDTLVLVHVLFRHGNRTADGPHELYPKDPYANETYFPYGLGQLTNTGKRKMFGVGKALRLTYNDFLGKYYYPNEVEAYSTDYNRTKMSLQLVLAGLFPPTESQIWEKQLPWQPIPFNYNPKYHDKVLLGVLCPRYLKLYQDVTLSQNMQKQFKEHEHIFGYISNSTGLKIQTFLDVYNLYFGISTQYEWGFTMPSWTKKVWPDVITQLAIKDYFVSMATKEMRKMATGYLLQKIIEDTKHRVLSSAKNRKKMYLYSAHENNIAELLMSLGVFQPHVPNYGAYVALEVHEIDNVFGIKIYYENYLNGGIQLLRIPGCTEFCPLDQFIEYTNELMPSNDLCGI